MATGNGTSDVNTTGGAEVLPTIMRASWSSAVDLARTLHTTVGILQLSFFDLISAQMRSNAALFARLAACRGAEDVLDAYMAYAATTLVNCESGLSKVIDMGTRVSGSVVSATLQPALAARSGVGM